MNQHYKSTSSDKSFNSISKELDNNGKICEILINFFENTSKQRKKEEDDYDSQFKDYRDINQDQKAKYINDKLSKLPIHYNLQKLNFDKVMMILMLLVYTLLLCTTKSQCILK